MRILQMFSSDMIKFTVVGACLALLSACSSTKNVPFTVQSDPLGAQVMLKRKSEGNVQTDWIWLGNTPLTTQRKFSSKFLNDEHSFVIQVMKDGFTPQTKEWSGKQVKSSSKGDNRIFWSPNLIEVNQ